MNDDDPPVTPHLETRMDGMSTPAPPASMDAVTTLIQSFGMMVTDIKRDLIREMERNASASRERWAIWEKLHNDYREETTRRLAALEATVHDHHAEAERSRLIAEARVKPVRTAASYLVEHWRTVALIVALILGWLLAGVESIEHLGL